jgi:hypothetical protein
MMSRKSSIFISVLLLVTLFGLAQFFFGQKSSPLTPSPTPLTSSISHLTSSAPVLGVTTKTGGCKSVDGLPDPGCTPGAIDPRVTQDNLFETICKKGYTTTVRPPASYTNKLKVEQIVAYGYADTNPHSYEEDHLISLELGGAPSDPSNLWPEQGASPNAKDKIENECNQKVCDGKISLHDAQIQIASNWHTACQ